MTESAVPNRNEPRVIPPADSGPALPIAVNISTVFSGLPLIARLDAARSAGFDVIETYWPSTSQLGSLSLRDFGEEVKRRKLTVSLLNFDAGDMPAGDRGIAGDPARCGDFRARIDDAISLAALVGCQKLNALAGNRRDEFEPSAHWDALVESVGLAADRAAAEGMLVLLESINPVENPRYLLPTLPDVLHVIELVGMTNVRFQCDVYHAAASGFDPVRVIHEADDLIANVQLADFPGRHEPGSGTIRFDKVIEALRQIHYTGAVALEFVPAQSNAPDFDCVRLLWS